uniref:Coiled-coil domain containing 88C n=1 Tax=Takifugu rubripes TaxID=31033 RepID=A0A674PNU9_TAKRU
MGKWVRVPENVNVCLHSDPSPNNQRLNKNVSNDVSLRLHNLSVLTGHIRTYYQDTLQQLIVMPLPDILCIAKDPISGNTFKLHLIIIIMLQYRFSLFLYKIKEMIEKIKLLDIATQAAIVSHIQEVTHNQLNVLDLSLLEEGSTIAQEDLETLSRNMALSLRQLIDQRDKGSEVLGLTFAAPQSIGINSSFLNGGSSMVVTGLTKEEKQHLAVELADTKAKLRRYRQEVEEKTEQLMDSKHEVERLEQELQRFKQENQSLFCEVRSVRAYRDEVDSLRERAARVDRLETELCRCKEKLNDVHFYKSRLEELREDNLTLMETKVLLEEQLSASRGRCDKLHTLEKDNLLLRAKLQDLEMERDSERRRLEELVEENMLLEIGQKQSMNESAHLGWELEQLTKNHDNSNAETRKSLVHELNECVSSRVLKLEKENRELQSSIERLKEDNHILEEQQLHSQELDRENQSLSKKVGGKCFIALHTLDQQTPDEKILYQLESEKQHLSEAVASLQERAQSNNEERVREVETENRLLLQSNTDTSSRLASLETQLKVANEEAARLKEKAERCEEVEREVSKLERSKDALSREVVSLRACSERSEALEKQVSTLEQDIHRLKWEAEEAQRDIQRLGRHEAESSRLSKENLDLRCSLENMRASCARLATLQEEHNKAQREFQDLQMKLEETQDEAQAEKKRVERLELAVSSLTQEKHKLAEQIQASKEEREELEKERLEAQAREEEVRREVEILKGEQKRKDEVEKEKSKLHLDLEQSEKARKHLEKESWRIRTLLEGKELELDEKTMRLTTVEKDNLSMSQDVNRLKETVVKAKELEKENKELQKQATIDKRTLATLREELVTEKLNLQQQSVELERLNEELEKIGLNREKLLQQEHTLDDSRYRLLESRLEETVQQTMKIKEQKISSLEKKVEESNAVNATLLAELTHQMLSALRQHKEDQNSHQHQRNEGSATAELLRLKDHLIDVEKNNASLKTETSLLKDQLKQLENQNTSLNNQMLALQRHTTTLQEQNTALHTGTAKQQVENSTLSSQSASLMAQNAVLQGQVTALETEVETWQRQRDEAWRGRESVLSDHDRLLSVHERQAHEYEQLICQHTTLKGKLRAIEGEHRTLQSKFTESHLQQSGQSKEFQQRIHELKGSLSSSELEVSQWKARYDTLMEQHQGLDLTMTKLDNHCELLSRLKGNLEEENHHLLSQINLLSQQNHTLLERSMESKEMYHQEQKIYIDKLNALRRQKEKLEEKIMDQYKFYDPAPKKRSQWSGAKALAKLIKPKKEHSRERGGDTDKDGVKEKEHTKSPPDIPLPAPPPLLPPETPPPLSHWTANDKQDGAHTHSNHNHHISTPSPGPLSPALTPINRGKHTHTYTHTLRQFIVVTWTRTTSVFL